MVRIPNEERGDQLPFPSNTDLREDRGDGRNALGKLLTSTIEFQHVFSKEKLWKELTDDDCQIIRECFSVYGNKKVLSTFDYLSNKFLGTIGSSFGSYNGEYYTSGIFTGCKTSENHEIWERIIRIQEIYSKEYFKIKMTTWSMPGSEKEEMYFEKNGLYYYDRECTLLANDSSKIFSSLLNKNRSWTDVLSVFGYTVKHDSIYRGRIDGSFHLEKKHLPYYNKITKVNRLEYPTERTICYRWETCCNAYSKGAIKNNHNSLYTFRQANNNEFFVSIENLRRDIARGLICGSVWDSTNKYEERIFWEALLNFCKANNISIESENQAYENSISQKLEPKKNIIINSDFRNSAMAFGYLDAPLNPDGFVGDCTVSCDDKDNRNILRISGVAEYIAYGVTKGKYELTIQSCGEGKIELLSLRKDDILSLLNNEKNLIMQIVVPSEMKYQKNIIKIKDAYVMGLKFKFVGNFSIMELALTISNN